MPARCSRRIASLAAALLLLGVTAVPADAAARPRCKLAGSKTIVATKTARVMSREVNEVRRYYGCRYRTNRRRLMAREETDDQGAGDTPFLIQLRGPFVAVATRHFDAADRFAPPEFLGHPGVAHAIDLRSGAHRRANAVSGVARSSEVTDLVLKPNGSLAWIGSSPYEVHRWEAGGADTVLESGTDIAPESLAESGTWLYWLRGGAPRFAAFN